MRTGLPAEVPSLDLCREMAAIPALAEAFKESALTWWCLTESEWGLLPRNLVGNNIPAPTVREMLAWLFAYGHRDTEDGEIWVGVSVGFSITDPDALAQACIAAVKASV